MFTKKPEAGDSVTKMGERRGGETKTERPATYGAKSPSASKMIPSIIGEGLTITGNVASKGEIQVDGEIQGDIHCGAGRPGVFEELSACQHDFAAADG